MLVLSRKVDEKIIIGDNITIVVNRIGGKRVTLGIEAPENIRIVRGELEPISKSSDSPPDPPPESSPTPPVAAPITHVLDQDHTPPLVPRNPR